MNGIGSHCSRHWLGALLLGAGLLLAGCAGAPVRHDAITLDGVVVDGQRLARADESGLVRINRNGSWIEGRAATVLEPGDQVSTGPTAYALIRYPSGTELFMRPNSSGRIGSFIDLVGEVFAKIRGVFEVQTTFVKAGAEGTAYSVRSTGAGDYSVVVYDGTVRLSSLTGAWPSVALARGTMTAGRPHVPPRPMAAPADELAQTRAWVERMETLVPPRAKTSSVGPALAIAALVAVIAAGSGDDDALPAPGAAAPGSGSAKDPAVLRSCRELALSWHAVSGAHDYLVTLDAAPAIDPGAWKRMSTPATTALSLPVGDELEGARLYRWHVQARAANGKAGASSAPLYFSCGSSRYR